MTWPGLHCGLRVYLANAISKIPFSPDLQYLQVRKSYFVPKVPIEWEREGRKIVCQFLTGYSFKGKSNCATQFGSSGSALSADINQI